jgi:GxxExxY protein
MMTKPIALKHSDITEKIIGCAMKVHSRMRSGYVESVYQKCLSIEFENSGLHFQMEVDHPIYYEGVIVGRRRVDFLIDDMIVVEIKALSEITNAHIAQALNYLETHQLEIGLLINFGGKSLQFKRLINERKLSNNQQKNPINPINL